MQFKRRPQNTRIGVLPYVLFLPSPAVYVMLCINTDDLSAGVKALQYL